MQNFKKETKGFTLVEIMVSVAIIAVISTVSVSTFYSSKRIESVRMAAQKLASDLRKTENFALALQDFNNSTPVGGWGISFNKNNASKGKYQIFADISSNHCYNNGELFFDNKIVEAEIAEITLTDLGGNSSTPNQVDISFLPPDPDVFICTNPATCDYKKAEITLKYTNGSVTSSVIINKTGSIDVNN